MLLTGNRMPLPPSRSPVVSLPPFARSDRFQWLGAGVRRSLPRFGCWVLSGLCLSLTACARVTSPVEVIPPLPQDPQIQAYFNHAASATYTDPYRQQQRLGDDLEQIMVATIAAAHSRVDVAVQELRLPSIAAALVDRHRAGVQVRVILENTYSHPWSELTPAAVASLDERERNRYREFFTLVDQNRDGQLSPAEIAERDTLIMLRQGGIPVIDDTADGSQGSGLMHHKFIIVDGQKVIVTSANFTMSDIHGDFQSPESRGNANNLLLISSPQLATLFTQEFDLMWGDGPGGKPDSKFGVQKPPRPVQTITVGTARLSVKFSPTGRKTPWTASTNGLIAETLTTARQHIDLALFVFSDQALANTLARQRGRGVTIRALIDPGFAFRSYSEGLDMLGLALAEKCKYESGNRPWSPAITTVGVPQLAPGDLLHHKFAVLDGQTVITGSHNWSEAANQQNDETLLVVKSPIVAAHYQREFDRLYQNAALGAPASFQAKLREQQQRCRSGR
ncbi:phospholipase D-like domain-containing protein [Trichothermofontia sichuanensis B231]|uniref:phospholipase D-like domain-containing protein n=1 Tax=Trichothermofontia sichuanensis TaxID=3045816 RepID=UPI002246EE79|nr:phospholipase D-like domain-containing protein [Trichothermofontia sichuanensis]UZQ54914.1 phospholipase D-like domain-containing protein [Trichothermofontia sichuanensis B231]